MQKIIRRNHHHYIAKPGQDERLLRLVGILGIPTVVTILVICISSVIRTHSSDSSIIADSSSGYAEPSSYVEQASNQSATETPAVQAQPAPLYPVLSVTDGDTIRIDYNGTSTPVRLIGVDTPETVDQRTTVQCFGQEASNYLKATLTGKKVSLEADPTQSDRDKYGRLLRYVYLDGEDIGLRIIANGYGHEYTYNVPYQKQTEYKAAERTADTQNLGLWSPSTCNGNTTQPANPEPTQEPTPEPTPAPTPEPQTTPTTECNIKGNISNKGEKIYHLPGQRYYDKTVITPSKGERYFCTEEEAVAAGWRKSKV